VIAVAAVVVGGIAFMVLRRSPQPPAFATPVPTLPAAVPAAPTAAPPEPPGPLTSLDPELRAAIEGTLASYAAAFEGRSAERLAAARPDLSQAERDALLARSAGALNVATDLRVLEVSASGDAAVVTLLRTDVIVGGRGNASAPVEEILRFERRRGAWSLRGRP
jgi:hypothetical protein